MTSVKWARRHPWQSALAGTTIAGLLAFVALSSWYNASLKAENLRAESKAAEARRNYRDARATIQKMLARFDEGRVAGSPRLIDLRRDLGEDAPGDARAGPKRHRPGHSARPCGVPADRGGESTGLRSCGGDHLLERRQCADQSAGGLIRSLCRFAIALVGGHEDGEIPGGCQPDDRVPG
jgi:uncharacterized membrane protein YdfJ with MMPL/SSD domain